MQQAVLRAVEGGPGHLFQTKSRNTSRLHCQLFLKQSAWRPEVDDDVGSGCRPQFPASGWSWLEALPLSFQPHISTHYLLEKLCHDFGRISGFCESAGSWGEGRSWCCSVQCWAVLQCVVLGWVGPCPNVSGAREGPVLLSEAGATQLVQTHSERT